MACKCLPRWHRLADGATENLKGNPVELVGVKPPRNARAGHRVAAIANGGHQRRCLWHYEFPFPVTLPPFRQYAPSVRLPVLGQRPAARFLPCRTWPVSLPAGLAQQPVGIYLLACDTHETTQSTARPITESSLNPHPLLASFQATAAGHGRDGRPEPDLGDVDSEDTRSQPCDRIR